MKKSKENILITRTLGKESPIWQLSNDGHQVIAQSFLEIKPILITQIPVADVYFYYSKNAAKYFLLSASSLQQDISKSDHAAMGNGTAQILESHGITPSFVGTDTPAKIAQSLIRKYANSSICFVRADQSTRSIQKLWPSKYSEAISYNTQPLFVEVKEEIHTILATSPMNLEAALSCCDISALKRIVCIGPTTYAIATKLSNTSIIVAHKSSEQAMLKAYLDSPIL